MWNKISLIQDDSEDDVEIFQRPSSYGQLVVEDADKDLDESLTSSELSNHWSWKPSDSQGRNLLNSVLRKTNVIVPEIFSRVINSCNNCCALYTD